jgi:hypothetical protein
VPIKAIHEAALRAYLSPAAQDQRDGMLSRHLNRFSRAVESVDWNAKMLIARGCIPVRLEPTYCLISIRIVSTSSRASSRRAVSIYLRFVVSNGLRASSRWPKIARKLNPPG